MNSIHGGIEQSIQTVASPGQLYNAAQDQSNQLQVQQQQEDYFQVAGSQNIPTIITNGQSLTQDEFQNLIKYDQSVSQSQQISSKLESTNSNGGNDGNSAFQPNFFEFSQRQNDNEKILAQANQAIADEQQQQSLHDQHQQLLAQQFSGTTVTVATPSGGEPMRIYVPDDEYQEHQTRLPNQNQIQHRSDGEIGTNNNNNIGVGGWSSEDINISRSREGNSKEVEGVE